LSSRSWRIASAYAGGFLKSEEEEAEEESEAEDGEDKENSKAQMANF